MRGFFAFLGGLLAEANGAGATFLLGAYGDSVSAFVGKIGVCVVPSGQEGFVGDDGGWCLGWCVIGRWFT
jgi:hypothetical protein